jgi:hypothetical protein
VLLELGNKFLKSEEKNWIEIESDFTALALSNESSASIGLNAGLCFSNESER